MAKRSRNLTNRPAANRTRTTTSPTSANEESRKSFTNSTGLDAQDDEDSCCVAVIGDVAADWSFISEKPTGPSGPVIHPWTQYPSTSLFAMPGGAWLSGHLVQGALAPPYFFRYYSARVVYDPQNPKSSVNISGRLGWAPPLASSASPDKFVITIELPSANLPTLIIDDVHTFSTDKYKAIQITIARDADISRALVEIAVREAVLHFDGEDTDNPGVVAVDQMARSYRAQCLQIRPVALGTKKDSGFDCGSITLSNVSCSIAKQRRDDLHWEHCADAQSLQLITDDVRRGAISSGLGLRINTNTSQSFYLDEAVIDVTFGRLHIRNAMYDNGKLNSYWNHDQVDSSYSGRANGKPIAEDRPMGIATAYTHESAVPMGGQSLRHLRMRPLGGKYSLWFYANPGASIWMQHPAHIVHSLSEIGLCAQNPSTSNKSQSPPASVFRRVHMRGIDGPRHGFPTILDRYEHTPSLLIKDCGAPEKRQLGELPAWESIQKSKIVVVDDLGFGFCGRPSLYAPFLLPPQLVGEFSDSRKFEEVLRHNEGLRKEISSYLANTWIVIKCSQWLNADVRRMVQYLRVYGASSRTILIVSGDSLRTGLISDQGRPGIELSRTVSWERTFDDFYSAVTDRKLGILSDAMHIVVRLGLEGAIHVERDQTRGDEKHQTSKEASRYSAGTVKLFFDPQCVEGEYANGHVHGEVPGLTSVLAAAIVQRLTKSMESLNSRPEHVGKVIADSIPYGMRCARRYYEVGFGPTTETVRKFERLHIPSTQVFGYAPIGSLEREGKHSFNVFTASLSAGAVSGGQDHQTGDEWSILTRQLDRKSCGTSVDEIAASNRPAAKRGFVALQLAREIVRIGSETAIARSKLHFPYGRIGNLLAVDRKEIEGIRGIRNLFAEYLGHSERRVPLSIAVFGPPGSGKSFGVKQIAANVVEGAGVSEFSFNLAQFNSFAEVGRMLLKVRDAGLEDRLPLVFFDEFDAPLNGEPLGWLKYFLAPMQDGRFQHDGQAFGLGKAIFVFAGGIASRHCDFTSDEFWRKQGKLKTEGNIYGPAKGPDFHSRLRGFLEIVGPNPLFTNAGSKRVDTEDPYYNDDFAFVVRRAVLIRQIIEAMAKNEPALIDSARRVEIDSDVLDALLLAEKYVHGVRSIQAIIEMSALHGERSFSKTALPPAIQCQMHVDESFWSILRRDYIQLKSPILQTVCKAS